MQEAFAADPGVLLSHTVKPEADSIAVLEQYARRNGIRSGKWHLLTGSREQIFRLARESCFVALDDTTRLPPTDHAHCLQRTLQRRTLRLFQRRGLLDQHTVADMPPRARPARTGASWPRRD